jgi:hypothetical protein
MNTPASAGKNFEGNDFGRSRVVTIRQIAKRAWAGPATIFNVLPGRRPVADSLRQAVLEVVQELGYELTQLVATLRLKRTRSIRFVVPNLTTTLDDLIMVPTRTNESATPLCEHYATACD